MRVIAGTYRSRPLAAPRGMDTRPTSDRLRETLFNILAPRIEGARFVDLYAGTGAVGIEAISRAASHVWFAEKEAPALQVLRQNLAALKITNGCTIEDRGTGALLARLAKLTQPIDILFLDPPYESANEYTATLSYLGSARAQSFLSPTSLIVAEHSSKLPLASAYGALHHARLVKQGDAALSFFEVRENLHPDANP